MRYAICNELFEGWSIEKTCRYVRELGYEGIELAPFTLTDDITTLSQTERHRIRAIAQQEQIEIVGLHWLLAKTKGYHLTSSNTDIRQRTADYFRELIRLCHDLGGKVLVLGSPQQRNFPSNMSYTEAEDNAIALLNAITPELESMDITLALEPLGSEEGNFMLTAESAIRLAEQVNSSHVKLHLDVKAMSTEPKPIAEIIRDSREWIVHFHANDPNRRGPGMGDIDFVPIFAALRDVNYCGWVSVEVFDYSPGIETLARMSIQNMMAAATTPKPNTVP